jgi:LysW-gamma-L-lysine carboxypeptidase
VSDLLHALVSISSPSGHESAAVNHLVAWMVARGFEAYVDAAGNAFGQRGQPDAPHTLLLLGHIDTVPGDIPVRVENGWLFGRGSVDAKGSLCAFAEAVAGASIHERWRVIVVGAVEEEAPSSKGAHLIRDQFEPDYCIIGEPSGADRIALGYKGHALIDYHLTRPTAHSSRPEPTAAALGAAFWSAMRRWADDQNRGRARSFDQVLATLRAINTSSDGLYDTVHLTVGFRLPPHLTADDVLEAARQRAERGADLRAYSTANAYLGGKNNALVRGMLAAIRSTGAQPGFVLKGGTSDMNVVGARWACPIIAYGPGDSALDHTPEERIALDEYGRAVAVLQGFIAGLG